jgi:hypothetical protein
MWCWGRIPCYLHLQCSKILRTGGILPQHHATLPIYGRNIIPVGWRLWLDLIKFFYKSKTLRNEALRPCSMLAFLHTLTYEGVSTSFRTGCLERELQMVQLSATRCSCIAILWVSLVSLTAITLCVASQRVFIVVSTYFVISPETFGYTLILSNFRKGGNNLIFWEVIRFWRIRFLFRNIGTFTSANGKTSCRCVSRVASGTWGKLFFVLRCNSIT